MTSNPPRIRWSRRVSPHKIRRLYESDARGMLDEDLLNDVGFGIYARCRDIIELAEAQRGRVKCRNCGNIIVRQRVNGLFDSLEVLRCDECSWEIACGDYHKSLLRDTLPDPYEAEHVYRSFVQQWPLLRSSHERLLLIDRLIHEFHVHYRGVGTPLGRDVIKATSEQIIELFEGLAYGFDSTEGLRETKALWASRLKAREMGVTKSDLQVVARDLGVKGASRMRKRELIDAIERVEPEFFEPLLNLIYGTEKTSPEERSDN